MTLMTLLNKVSVYSQNYFSMNLTIIVLPYSWLFFPLSVTAIDLSPKILNNNSRKKTVYVF